MDDPSGAVHVPTANLFLACGAHLQLESDWRRGLGWWRVEGPVRVHVTVGEAFTEAPSSLRHEVLLEARQLIDAVMRLDQRDADDGIRRAAASSLTAEIREAMTSLRDMPQMRSFGHDLADRLAG